MGERQSGFRSAEDEEWVRSWVAAVVGRSRTPLSSSWVNTRFGRTHVLRTEPVPSGREILCLPGWGTSAPFWALGEGLEPLARVSRTAIVDIPGQPGLSSGRVPRYAASGYTAWLADVLDGLGAGEVDLIGSSAGAYLAAKAAPDLGARVRRMVLCAPAGFVIPWLAPRILGALASHLFRPSREHTAGFVRACMLGPEQEMAPEAFSELVEVLLRSATGFRNRSRPPGMLTRRDLNRIKHETLVLVGELDPNFSASRTVARARRWMPALSDAEIIGGHGHILELSGTAMGRAAHFIEAM